MDMALREVKGGGSLRDEELGPPRLDCPSTTILLTTSGSPKGRSPPAARSCYCVREVTLSPPKVSGLLSRTCMEAVHPSGGHTGRYHSVLRRRAVTSKRPYVMRRLAQGAASSVYDECRKASEWQIETSLMFETTSAPIIARSLL